MFSARVHTAIHPFAGLAEADEKWERPRTAAEPAIDGPRQRQANCVDALPLTIPAFAQCLQSGAAMCCHDGRGSRGHCGPVPIQIGQRCRSYLIRWTNGVQMA